MNAEFERMSPAARRELFVQIFPSIMIPMYLAIADQTILASAMPSIIGSLGGAERISWIMASYLVATTLSAPIYGYLGDILGRRNLMFAALAIFILASIYCAFAPGVWSLVAGRFIQGVGGGGLMAISQALVGEAVPARERGNFQGYLATVGAVSTSIGPVLGGYLTQHLGWRYVFIFNIPVALVAVALTFRLPMRTSLRRTGWRFDAQGLVLFVMFVLPVMFGLEQAQRFNLESLPRIVALFALAGAALFVLIRHESKTATPLIPVNILRKKVIWQSNLMVLCQGAMLSSLITFLPLYARVVRGASASETGWLLVPMTVGLSIGSIITGRLLSRTGRTMIFPSIALIPGGALLIGFAIASPDLSLDQIAWLLGVTAIMLGSLMSVVQVTVQVAAGPQHLGAAAASIQFARSIGAAFGTALFATVLFATMAARDPESAPLFARLLDAGPSVLDALDAARRAAVQDEIVSAFRIGFLVSASFTCIAMVLAWVNPMRRV